ncbi:beta-galactosidase [Pedobacter steynii]|uniref:Beta-galactosidase n=1 Tax=Pedobacter steynii TaxID=430522 RepID=A0A1G9V2C4_9SPHI|nr:beta-galactosidase family protein [Pedobacter steynii]NQX40957.1 beta-galactosidase [Pedobacter steynii]SDM66240.1 beta-galactosidase [Pedobacter steynii]
MKILRSIFCILALPLAIVTNTEKANAQQHTFALGDSTFLLDNKPFQIISGEIHYPRVPRAAWRQRMKMAKAMGLNTIGTYVFWNLHEPEKNKFDFSGNNDIAEFVRIAKEEGLWVILRPSPYVCAEWEFGGYPYWLQNEKGLEVRSKEKQYLKEYETYIKAVGKQLAPLQINHGGNILMVQVENEYGSYSNDKEYLSINRELFKEAGFDGLLYTCDPEADLSNGHLPGLLPAINGQDNPAIVKSKIKALNEGKGPFFIAEWYPAWFDWWGTPHHTVPAEKYTGKLDAVLKAGISINMYMFHGGSTRGFMNGANYKETTPYEPQISSYDYDAPLDEAGNATDKFMKFRTVIQNNLPAGQTLPEVPAAKPSMTIPAIQFQSAIKVADLLTNPVRNLKPMTFEDLNQAYGFVWYRSTLNGGKTGTLKIKELRDYAVIMVNGKRIGTLDRRNAQDSLSISLPKGKVTLDILVENQGRINFGPNLLKNKKGITASVSFAGTEVKNWTMFKLPFLTVNQLKFKSAYKADHTPVVRKGTFTLNTIADTYLDMQKWGKGMVWVNGNNLGKYWEVGPQQTLYLPAEWLKKGKNEIVVLELNKPEQTTLSGLAKPILDQVKPNVK